MPNFLEIPVRNTIIHKLRKNNEEDNPTKVIMAEEL
jgi:hypothetical protein